MDQPIIQQIPLDKLAPWSDNPRSITEGALDRLSSSVEEFGFLQPVIWNKRTSHIVSGHQRVEVLKRAGEDSAPCIVVDWDEQREAAAALAFNAEFGLWNGAKLEHLLKKLQSAGYDTLKTALPTYQISEALQSGTYSNSRLPLGSSAAPDMPAATPPAGSPAPLGAAGVPPAPAALATGHPCTCPTCGNEHQSPGV